MDLTKEAFGSTLWNLTDELSHVSTDAVSRIKMAALLLGFLVVAFQVFTIMWQSHKDDIHTSLKMPQRLLFLFIQVGFVAAILTTGVYDVFYRYVIGVPAETIAESITVIYIDDYQDQAQKIYNQSESGAKNIYSIVTATFNGSLVTTLISSFFFVLNSIFVYLFPMLQGKFFLYLYYVGPLALIFTFCDYTQHVAKAWINLSLSVAWAGVFGSIALLISVKGGVLTGVEQGIGSNDWISTAVYSLSSLLLLTLSFPISQYFFGAMGSGLSNSPSSMARSAGSFAGGAFTAGAATASVAGKVMSKIGSTINKSGSGVGGTNNASVSSSGSPSINFSSGGSSNTSASNQSSSAFGGTGATASTVPMNRPIMDRIGSALIKGGDFLNKAGKDALTLSEINSNMPRDAVKKIENIIDGNTPDNIVTPGNGKKTA